MNAETPSIDLLKHFLKEMFQFNANDLDFGIYKIYNLKRKEIEGFIDCTEEHCLEPTINRTLQDVSNLEKKVELQELFSFLKEKNDEAMLDDISANFEDIQALINLRLKSDEAKRERLINALKSSTQQFNITDELKDKIYNHILGFFEMYYSNGDFGYNNRSRSLYKVPYEADYDGNDTMFHWKHKGSLYIKTGNAFNAIKFKLNHLGKEFELRLETNDDSENEGVAQNNNKDTQLKHYKFNRFEDVDGVTRIVFNLSSSSTTKADLFKALFKDVFKSDVELDKYLFSEEKPVFSDLTDDYDKVENGNVKGIGALRVKRSTLLTKINKNFPTGSKVEIVEQDGQERFSDETLETLYNIDQKLNSFYIGNDSDYFIHEDLQGFLTQEKERFIKNYILGDLNTILNGKLDNTTLIIAKAFNDVTDRIIEFLSAIEEFQKKLFTMKKKIVECEYCLTIDNINEQYYPEILANQAQLTEWDNLFSVKVTKIDDLKAQPTLVLDTNFFKQADGSNDFKDKVLAEIDLLDEKTNGLLVSSENYQGLNFLTERFRKSIDCIHIDPPYNSNTSGFLYKNHFKHSSWLSMMDNRLKVGNDLLDTSGSLLCHIDENEYENLHQLMCQFPKKYMGTLIWDKRNPMNGGTGLALQHEHVIWQTNSDKPIQFRNENAIVIIRMADELISKNGGIVNDKIRKDFSKWVNNHPEFSGGDKAYRYIDEKGQVYQSVSLRAPEPRTDSKFFEPLIHPKTKKACAVPPNGFSRTPETLREMMDRGEILFGDDEQTQPRQKIILNEEVKKQMPSILQDAKKGKSELKGMGLDFPYNHSSSVYEKLISTAVGEKNGVVLDFFAGSGTSGHAVVNINRVGDRHIKYILVEMGGYFSSITKPRIQKAIFSSKWSKGKPQKANGSHKSIFKYFKLEQYEDVLDAIEQFDGDTPKNLPLKYLYKPELNQLESSLDLSKPFSNQVKYGQPTKVGFVDLVETYNYLQGYEIKTIKPYNISNKYYKVLETTDGTLVIWRDIALAEDDSEAVKTIIGHYPDASRVDINFDFNILATLKDKQLPVGDRVLSLNIIHAQVFSE